MNDTTRHRRYKRLFALVERQHPEWIIHYVAFQTRRKLKVGRGHWLIDYTIQAHLPKPGFTMSLTLWAPSGRATRQAVKTPPEQVLWLERSMRRSGYRGKWQSLSPTVRMAHYRKRLKDERSVTAEMKRLKALESGVK